MSDSSSNHPPHSDYDEKVSVVSEHAPAVRREKPDPRTGTEPLSLWTFFLAAVVLMIGGCFLGGATGGSGNLFGSLSQFTSASYQPLPPPAGPGGTDSKLVWIDRWTKDGKKTFENTCAACHKSDGKGQAGLYPPLANSEYVFGGTDRLSNILLNGLQGPITVAGGAYNSAMQPWKATLNDKQIAQVMTYVRRNFGNAEKLANGEDGIVTEEMTKAAREKHAKNAVLTGGDIATDAGNLPGAKVDPLTGQPAK